MNILRESMLALSKVGARVFRNNVAQAVVGQVTWIRQPARVVVGPGDAVVRGARVLHAGLCKDSPDLVGWTSLVIKPEHVGRQAAVFTSPEIKAPGGKIAPGQRNFAEQVITAGGIAGFAHSPAEAVALRERCGW